MSDLYKKRLNDSLYHSSYSPGDRVVLEVRFTQGGKTYCYDAAPGVYYPGDKVFVKVNEGYKDVTVYKAYYYDSADYPFDTLPLKSIEGLADDTEYIYSTRTKDKPAEKSNVIKTKSNNEYITENFSYNCDHACNEGATETAQYNSSSSYNDKPKSRKILIAFIIIAIVGVLQGPTWYRNYLDSQPLYNADIAGTWKSEYGIQEIDFNSDHSAKVKGEDYFIGKWEIVSESDQTINLHYIVSEHQLDLYNEKFSCEMDGYIATKEDVLEWETEYYDDLPPEGIYQFRRSTNQLIHLDGDYYLEKR